MPKTKTPKIINPKIYAIATTAFNNAFGDSIDYEDNKVKKLILAYSALLEIGAEYIELRAFKRIHDHLFSDEVEKPPRKNLGKKE